ncbi:isoprenyl transferase [Tissierella sp. Yu-01]|uniref:isoprenyl transferase n=1 Tax=Tissierella sp. Yu-01 TaxID=3035694 RepID=UPI00240CF7B6|nr:isoprenyl transferase [Tissierella sp. Yu-01]WFA09769.1 isoprenyl transferase [Tissierella sp. Yu-01]
MINIYDLKSKIDFDNLPKHIAIIMDGNGRWAEKRSLPRNFGHQEGMERVIEIVESASQIGIKYLTLYAFSTENWKRPITEIEGLMKILVLYIRRELDRLHKNNIKLNILGDINKLPEAPRKEVIRAIEKTEHNIKMVLNIALNYGGRDEIIYGIKKYLKDVEVGKITYDDLNADNFSNYLYTKGQPDPDLVIRPSGELRLSNFLLYQIAYSEFYFSNILWPDFKENYLYEAIIDYQNRNRRFGGI